jgi:hypothetical protein
MIMFAIALNDVSHLKNLLSSTKLTCEQAGWANFESYNLTAFLIRRTGIESGSISRRNLMRANGSYMYFMVSKQDKY